MLSRLVGQRLRRVERLVPKGSSGPGCSWQDLDGPFLLAFDGQELLIRSVPTVDGDELRLHEGIPQSFNLRALDRLGIGRHGFWRDWLGREASAFYDIRVAGLACGLAVAFVRAGRLYFFVENDDLDVVSDWAQLTLPAARMERVV